MREMESQTSITFRSIIRHYQKHYLPNREFERFRNEMPSLVTAIEAAALSVDDDGEIYDHQIDPTGKPVAEFRKAADALCMSAHEIEDCRNFDSLLNVVEAVLKGTFPGSDKRLYVYDVAFRTSLYLDMQRAGLLPTLIYLHCGVTKGAHALGIGTKGRRSIAVSELPRELQHLPAWQLEDVLCIYHKELSEAMAARAIVQPHRSRCRKSRRFRKPVDCSMPVSAVAPATCLS